MYICFLKKYIMTQKTNDILNEAGLNWKVKMESITTESGVELDDYKAIIREDTNAPLSVRSNEYYPYQNYELIELLEKVSNKTGLELKKGGSFKDGARVYVQLKSDNLKLGNDTIEGYLTGINSFDGSTSLAFGPSNLTISCQNTFFAAFRELNTKIRHTRNMVVKIDEVCVALEGVIEEEQNIFKNIVRLSEISIGNNDIDNVIKKLFNIKKDLDLKDVEAISTVTRNKLSRFSVDLNGEIQSKGGNLWGLFSGVTKYTTHSMTKNDNTESKMFGIYGKRELEIFNSLVKEHS